MIPLVHKRGMVLSDELEDDVFSLSEQHNLLVETDTRARRAEVRAGHVEIIGDKRVATIKLIAGLLEQGHAAGTRRKIFAAGDQLPARVMDSIRIEPVRMLPLGSTSLPTATSPRNMSLRLPAMVISSTGYWITPFSTQKPAAPRE